MRALAILAIAVMGCGPGGRHNGSCTADETHCEGNVFQRCKDGKFVDTQTCPQACSEGIGCTMCEVGAATCSGDTATVCNDSGTGFVDVFCDPVQGMSCDPNAVGGCVGACAPKSIGTSYIGCDYFPTVTGNTTGTQFDFAVAIANTTTSQASVTIDGGALGAPQVVTVPPSSVVVKTLPWQIALKLCNQPFTDGCGPGTVQTAALAQKGAYHLRSTVPVTVYQFNPLEYGNGSDFSYSNDASSADGFLTRSFQSRVVNRIAPKANAAARNTPAGNAGIRSPRFIEANASSPAPSALVPASGPSASTRSARSRSSSCTWRRSPPVPGP